MSKGSDLLVQALENEGVDRIFGIPGEENLDVVESLRGSKIELVLTRHEQAASFMAATHGRLTGRPGVCLATLGPGALNFTTGAAYAHLGAMPMLMLTGQKPIKHARQARFQIVDIVGTMRPLTKMTRQIISAASIPTMVRDAFRIAMEERPGPVHLELPEDIAAEQGEAELVPIHRIDRPVPPAEAVERVAEMILQARCPLIMIGAGGNRPRLVEPLSDFVRRARIPFFNTQMGKGAVTGSSDLYMGTAALSERDYVHDAIDCADLIVAIGHDTVEKPPFLMGGVHRKRKVVYVGFQPANVEQVFFPDAELIGDIGASVTALAQRLEGKIRTGADMLALREKILAHINEESESSRFPVIPQRLVRDVRAVMPEKGIVCLDNGMYKIWFARNYRTRV
uniref:acetolactate synthase large subunit n=1 Tax=uncultured Bradyrhizobium sp. TaxID=199684 RepID=UPI00261A3ECA